MNIKQRKLVVGNWVEIRSKEEILNTLDHDGCLDGMPFMPEMLQYCGHRFRVYKRAHKTCDTVFPVRSRRIDRAVHLETRCDGSAHGDCQAACLIFWKEAWLKPVEDDSTTRIVPLQQKRPSELALPVDHGCGESVVWSKTRLIGSDGTEPVYSCQATRLPYATTDLEWWYIRQYIEDYLSGNVTLWRIFCGAMYWVFYSLSQAGIGLGRPLRWFYSRFYPLWHGVPYPLRTGTIPLGQQTPVMDLNLQPGELVRIKPHEEILQTLNIGKKNRGMFWDAELVPFCGGTYRVLKRVTQILDETTGKMHYMKTPCVILDSVVCEARYASCRMFCPRSIYPYWREIWLERVGSPTSTAEAAMLPTQSSSVHICKPPRPRRT